MTSTSPVPGKTWRVGTLTYTTGGLLALFSWLLWGDFSWSLRDRAIPAVMQLLFKNFGASDMMTGVLFSSLPAAIAFLLGPVVGYRSDRLRSRWGRRIPFLILPTPLIVLATVGLAFSPQAGAALDHWLGSHSPGLHPSILIFMAACWTVFEFSCVTVNAVLGGLINDVVPQEVLGRFFGAFRAFGLLAAIVFNFWVMGKAETAFSWIFLGVGLLYGVSFTLMCLKVKEGQYPPPPEATRGGFGAVAASYVRDLFGLPYYRWYFAFYTLIFLVANPFNLYAVFYAKSLGMGLGTYGKCLAATYVISLCLAYPLGFLADRFHPLRVTLGALALYAGIMAWGIGFTRDVGTFSIALIAGGVLSGVILTAASSLGQRLLPKARFGELNAAALAFNSLALILMAPLIGTILDHTGHAYRYTFHAGLLVSLLAILVGFVLNAKFTALGGTKHYVAPE